MRILINNQGDRFYHKQGDLHTKFGVFKSEDIQKAKDGDSLKSHLGNEFCVYTPNYIDDYRRLKRQAQIITLKDLGIILSNTLVNKKSTILEAGAGSGAATCFFARYVKKVISYELRPDHIKTVEANIKMLGIKNVVLKNVDAYIKINERNLDLVLLDLPEPWKALKNIEKALKPGAFLVCYNPCINQNQQLLNSLSDKFLHIKTIELIEREWHASGIRVRPKTQGMHTGFLTFIQKIKR